MRRARDASVKGRALVIGVQLRHAMRLGHQKSSIGRSADQATSAVVRSFRETEAQLNSGMDFAEISSGPLFRRGRVDRSHADAALHLALKGSSLAKRST